MNGKGDSFRQVADWRHYRSEFDRIFAKPNMMAIDKACAKQTQIANTNSPAKNAGNDCAMLKSYETPSNSDSRAKHD